MNSAIERLLSLRVSDVMSRNVVDVSPSESLEKAAATLASHELSAAPVVDAQGQCVGMLSATDFLLARCATEVSEHVGLSNGEATTPECKSNVSSASSDVDTEKVELHMSRSLQTVAADDTLVEASRRMCGVHVHRMPVLDQQGQVLGMISSLDIAAALVTAIEE